MELSPYLSFNGDCAEALKFYEQTLGAKIVLALPYGGSPMGEHVPADWSDKLMHARVMIGGRQVMASDAMPGRYKAPCGFSLNLEAADEHEADRLFAALADRGEVHMPIQETFWAKRFGVVTDRFGTPWMVDCEKPAGS
jgi:PhnB protein